MVCLPETGKNHGHAVELKPVDSVDSPIGKAVNGEGKWLLLAGYLSGVRGRDLDRGTVFDEGSAEALKG
jgi:hypothetical protein